MNRPRRILGIELRDAALELVQLRRQGRGWRREGGASFAFPPDAGWDRPAELGRALRTFLETHGLRARQAVLGLPAGRLLCRQGSPGDAAGDVAWDRVGGLHLGASRAVLERAQELLRAAGLWPRAVSASVLALAGAEPRAEGGDLLWRRGDRGLEWWWRGPDGPISLAVANAEHAADDETCARAVTRSAQAVASERGLASPPAPRPLVGDAAELLARSVGEAQDQQVDFLHPRGALAPRRQLRRRLAWTAAAVTLLAAGLAQYAGEVQRRRNDLAILDSRLAAWAGDIAQARTQVELVAKTRGHYDRRPAYLECLRALTLSLPAEGGIWINSLAAQADLRCVVSGKARDRRLVLEALETLRASAAFAEVKLIDLRAAPKNGGEVGFSLSFVFRGAGGA